MTIFLYSAAGEGGQALSGRIDAASLDAAKFRLEQQGLREIVFHTDEMNAQIAKAHGYAPRTEVSAAQEVRSRHSNNGGLAFIGRVYVGNWIVWLPVTCWTLWDLWKGQPYSIGAYLRFVLTGLALLFPLWAAVPARAYNALLDASAWARWDEVRARCSALRRWGWLFRGKVPALELDVREACAMAAQGDLPGALESLKKHATTVQPHAVYLSRLASVYTAAKEWTDMAHCQEEAWRESHGATPQAIDYATTLIWRLRDADGAERVLANVAGKERAAMAQAFTDYAEGLIAQERQQATLAREKLQSALTAVRSYDNPSVQALADFIQAHLAIATANAGDKTQARQLLRASLPRLTAHKDLDLARRCAAAIGR